VILFVSVILLSVLAGYLAGGRLRGFDRLRLKYWWLAPLGLGLQFLPLPDASQGTDLAVRVGVLGLSYLMLLVFAGVNVGLPGVPLLFVGLALNATVIVANGGMPVSPHALETSGQSVELALLAEDQGAKHHLMTSSDHLTPLADVIPIPPPIRQVASVGDAFVYAGLAWLIVAVMRGRIGEPAPPVGVRRRYRGKHRPGAVRAPAGGVDPPPARATASGT
jgi:Family of unknown function (DUF5317)